MVLAKGRFAYGCSGCGKIFEGNPSLMVYKDKRKAMIYCKECEEKLWSDVQMMHDLLQKFDDENNNNGKEQKNERQRDNERN